MKKIMFNDKFGLTDAVLSGRKTMTRRIVPDSTLRMARLEDRVCLSPFEECIKYHSYFLYQDEVAIAQRYSELAKTDDFFNCEQAKRQFGWNNKMYVRSDVMPHRIRITDVKVERLQDISDEDCIKEGIFEDAEEHGGLYTTPFYDFYENDKNGFSSPREAYAALIDRISGKGTWQRNPWVFSIKFELIK